MTGITRVSKESIFSDLNNLEVVTTTSNKYETAFGFTEQEVFAALDEYGLQDEKQAVKSWYDGFTFGKARDIYNPWSIINYLDKRRLATYWANTSSNSLADKLIREGSPDVKMEFEVLLEGGALRRRIDEQIVFQQLSGNEDAIWSMLLASGYLRVDSCWMDKTTYDFWYQLSLTNTEVRIMFREMIRGWFKKAQSDCNAFVKALLEDDLKGMNICMNRVAMAMFSYFDTGKHSSAHTEPERFYHGFVLGLLVELSDRYVITSNRESGFGRYDVMVEPKDRRDAAMILEFKVYDPDGEKTLQDTAQHALEQIRNQNYAADLIARGIPEENIRSYGFAFEGKKVLIAK